MYSVFNLLQWTRLWNDIHNITVNMCCPGQKSPTYVIFVADTDLRLRPRSRSHISIVQFFTQYSQTQCHYSFMKEQYLQDWVIQQQYRTNKTAAALGINQSWSNRATEFNATSNCKLLRLIWNTCRLYHLQKDQCNARWGTLLRSVYLLYCSSRDRWREL